MSTIPPITAERQRLELNGGPDSLLTCGRGNYRERRDPLGAFGDRAEEWESCSRGGLDPVRCDGARWVNKPKAEGATDVQGGSVMNRVHRPDSCTPKLE